MQTSGLVLDIYDDPSSLKAIWPSESDVPEVVKEAHVLSQQERAGLPDSTFALVLLNGEEERLRKYACADAGNTALSMVYFLKHGHKLPAEAQKVAAENLTKAAGWYDLEVPEPIEKIAIGVARALHLGLVGPSVAKGTSQDISQNLAAVNALESPRGTIGGQVVTPQQMKAVGPMMKRGEASLTHLQPGQAPSDKSVTRKAVIQKTADSLPERKDAGETLTTTEGTAGEQYQKAPQAKDMKPHVDVSNKEPPKLVAEKKASRYALPELKAYPLDGYDQVKEASAYFNEMSARMTPAVRHEYCIHMVKRADELGIKVSDDARKYGSETYAPAYEIKVAFDARRNVITDPFAQDMFDSLEEKRATVSAEVFCEALEELDKFAEIEWRYDSAISDPYYSTFGIQKTAADDSWSEGNDFITKKQIENYAKTALAVIMSQYGHDFADEFKKDPWGIFNSLPVDQKKMMSRAASDNSPTGTANVA
jgi:hypothetical protein